MAVASHGSQAPPPPPTATRASTRTASTRASTRDETIRTTANHPWLTADRGWAQAGSLRLGERVVRADGSAATVVALRDVAGTAPMYDLTVANLHDFAVGSGQFVVHNCDFKTFKGNNRGVFGDDAQAKAAYRKLKAIDGVRRPYEGANVSDDPLPGSYKKDGDIFQNNEGHLPRKADGYYKEYQVLYGADNTNRLVIGRGGDVWFSATHYGNLPDGPPFNRLWWRN